MQPRTHAKKDEVANDLDVALTPANMSVLARRMGHERSDARLLEIARAGEE